MTQSKVNTDMNGNAAFSADKAFDSESIWGSHAAVGAEKILLGCCHSLPASPHFWYSLNKGLRGPLKSGKQRCFDVEVLAMKLRLINSGNYCETTALLAPQYYDTTELQWLRSNLQDGSVFVDIGGNIGLYSLVAANSNPRLQVITVEPDPRLARRMKFNAQTNNLSVTHCQVALSDYIGTGELDIQVEQSGANSLSPATKNANSELTQANGNLSVNVTTLQQLCSDNGLTTIDLMKIDIEGHEHKVLSHFIENTSESLWPKRIIIESVHDSDAVIPLLIDKAGYVMEKETKRNCLLRR